MAFGVHAQFASVPEAHSFTRVPSIVLELTLSTYQVIVNK